jgi:hypothetical protein
MLVPLNPDEISALSADWLEVSPKLAGT